MTTLSEPFETTKSTKSTSNLHIESSEPVIGITNHGNTCYVNSTIQCLNTVDDLARYFVLDEDKVSSIDNPLLRSLSYLLKSLWLKNLDCNSLSKNFCKKLESSANFFRFNEQQDAQEFLLYLLNHCLEGLMSPADGGSIVSRMFLSQQQLSIDCPACAGRQLRLEPHLCLSLPVPAGADEPLPLCLVGPNGSQLHSAVMVNSSSPFNVVRLNIAQYFKLKVNNLILMAVNESGYGIIFQDCQQASDLLSTENSDYNSLKTNLWNGVIALEAPSQSPPHPSCLGNDSDPLPASKESPHQIIRHISPNGSRGNSSQFAASNGHIAQNPNGDAINHQKVSSDTQEDSGRAFVTLLIIHVEEICATSQVSSWKRFTSPMTLYVPKEIEFKVLESMVLGQLEKVYQCLVRSKLTSQLRFLVWDGLKGTEREVTSEHQFPLLTEAVESVAGWSEGVVRMVGVWSTANAHALRQAVLTATGRRMVEASGRDPRKFTLIDLWQSINEDHSAESIIKEIREKRYKGSKTRYVNLEDCLKAYLSEEVLDERDAWRCTDCGQFQRATITNTIHTLPEIMILHLKRFQSCSLTSNGYGNRASNDHTDVKVGTIGGNDSSVHSPSSVPRNGTNNKLNILVDYPLRGLDMKSFVSQEAIKNSREGGSAAHYYYDLIAVCNHQGTLSSGHYTAFCLNSVDHKWRFFNDNIVKEVVLEKVIQSKAYILFYQRRVTTARAGTHWSLALTPSSLRNPSKSSPITRSNLTETSKKGLARSKSNCGTDNGGRDRRRQPVVDVTAGKVKTEPRRISQQKMTPSRVKGYQKREVVSDGSGETSCDGSTSYDEYVPPKVVPGRSRLPGRVPSRLCTPSRSQ